MLSVKLIVSISTSSEACTIYDYIVRVVGLEIPKQHDDFSGASYRDLLSEIRIG